jgi:hypothetical protein
MKLIRKNEAIDYYNRLKEKNGMYFFQEDIDRAGSKCFHIDTTRSIFNKIKHLARPHFYEFWMNQTKMVFSVDIDFNTKKDNTDPDELLRTIISIVKEGAYKYYKYNYKTSDIIILENDIEMQRMDNPSKYSAHIIFRGLEFQSYVGTKDFYLRLEKEYKISQYYVDKSIYNMTCLRLLLNSKMNKTSILVPKKLLINEEYTKACAFGNSEEKLYEFFLQSMITYTTGGKLVTSKDYIHNINVLAPKYIENDKDISNINIESILTSLPSRYYDNYDLWIKIGMILYAHSTDDNNLFELWNEWSKQSNKYKEKEMNSKWRSFAKSNKCLSIGTLIKWAKDEGIINIYKNVKQNVKQSIDTIVSSYPVKPINLDISNIDDTHITILNQEKLTEDTYIPIIRNKLIAVQSEKGTGKTSNLLKTLFTESHSWVNEDTSVLFISSRITFGYKLLGDLKDYGFELYSQIKDHKIRAKRIICQIDSLLRLEYEKYDIIIVDECESLARYLTSSHFTKNNKASLIVTYLESRLADAKQIYILDADLSDRCIKYYKTAINMITDDEFHLIINTFKPYREYQLTYCHYATWLRKILLMLENNKKLVIAMASNSKAKDLNKKLTDTFPGKKILLIHRETTDEDKKNLLLKVNDEWIKYDVIIYTPSVCMGVSFDITGHFDYIFAYGCHESLGAQEWCQMIHRVRSPINKEIFIAIDQYKSYDINEDLVTYASVEKMLCSDYYLTNYDLHNNIVHKKIIKIKELDNNIIPTTIGSVALNDKVLYYPYKLEPIYDLYVRNCWELIENKLNFPACFFGYAKYKEYKLMFASLNENDKEILKEMKDIRADREELEDEEKLNGIINANDMTDEEYQEKIKQRNEYVSKEDLYSIYRYNLRRCYNIYPKENPEPDDSYNIETIDNGYLTNSFVTEYIDKEKMLWYRNLATVLSTDTLTTNNKLEILRYNQQYDSKVTNCYINFTHKNKYTYHYYPLTIINDLGFDINDLSISIANPEIICRIYSVIEWCEDRKDDINFKYNIKTTSKKLSDLNDTFQLKYINRILESQYGLKIKQINKSVNKDNILYRLDDGDKWNNLPDIINYSNEELKNPVNMYNLKRKIKPFELKQKGLNITNDFDTTNLDVDIFLDD